MPGFVALFFGWGVIFASNIVVFLYFSAYFSYFQLISQIIYPSTANFCHFLLCLLVQAA